MVKKVTTIKEFQKSINKSSNYGEKVDRFSLKGMPQTIGFDGLTRISSYVDKEKVRDLRWPNSLTTYDKMDYDSYVWLASHFTQILVEKGLRNRRVVGNKNNPDSIKAAEYIDWCLDNMETSFVQTGRDANTAKKYGFAVIAKRYETHNDPEWTKEGYSVKIKKLAPRDQHTLHHTEPFTFDADGNVRYVNQDTNLIKQQGIFFNSVNQSPKIDVGGKSVVSIPRNRFMLFSYNSSNGNPLGASPRKAAYKAYKEKMMIEDFSVMGVTKDLNGVPVLYLPAEILDDAHSNPSGASAQMVQSLMQDMANWYAGEQAYMILPSNIQEGSNNMRQFDVKLQGVEGGGGKSYAIDKLIDDRTKAILNCYGAGFLLLGQNQTGSYNLADTQAGVHGFFVENDIEFILEVINRELIPQLLALNDVRLSHKDMPKVEAGVVDERDLDILSKFIQRVSATGNLPIHPQIINEVLGDLGSDYRIPEEFMNNPEKWSDYLSTYMPKVTTRSGDGLPTSGSGTGYDIDEEDLDASNLES